MGEYLSVDKETAVKVALSMYLGERCKFCGRVFETLDDLDDAVYAGYHEHGRIAHKTCWNKAKADDQGEGEGE